VKSYTSDRSEEHEYVREIDGELFTFRPKKKSSALVKMMVAVDPDNADVRTLSLVRAQIEFLEDALDRSHRKTKKQDGHGDESVEGCQACRMWDRLNDEDDELSLDTLIKVASDLMSEVSGRPTG
jgi:hypothetical protein